MKPIIFSLCDLLIIFFRGSVYFFTDIIRSLLSVGEKMRKQSIYTIKDCACVQSTMGGHRDSQSIEAYSNKNAHKSE